MSDPAHDVLRVRDHVAVARTRGGENARTFTVRGHLGLPTALDVAATWAIDRTLGLHMLERLYTACAGDSTAFAERALAALGVAVDAQGRGVPATGGLLVVANHPCGALDGLALLAWLRRTRGDVKLLANSFLQHIPELRPWLLAVDVFGAATHRARGNAAAMRAAVAWLSHGGCLVAFPAGEVASRVVSPGVSLDGEWHPHVAILAARTAVPVVPVFIEGSNSRLFRALGRVHPLLRTAWLARELLKKRGATLRLTAGAVIGSRELTQVPHGERAAYLRARTYVLAEAAGSDPCAVPSAPRAHPLAPAVPPDLLVTEIAALPADRLVARGGGLEVYCARAGEIPHVLGEIGRLREETFRAAGEGTGRPSDLDRFDAYYWQLFAWDPSRAAVAGAYRLGATDEIVPRHGVEGLYTRTLFRYDRRLLDEIGPALELGRSFVSPAYQREFAPLLMLWKGIGRVVARTPRYRRVFGAVSISNRYGSVSRHLLARFLLEAALHPSAARLVESPRPLPPPPAAPLLEGVAIASLEFVSGLVRAVEKDGKTIPVLLRQYLNLNARLLGFSVDPAFGDALDGLMLADLADVPRPMLARLMGKEDADAFLARTMEGDAGARHAAA